MAEHPFIPVPNVAELVLKYSAFGYPFSNTFNFSKATPWQDEDLEVLTDVVDEDWGTALGSAFSAQVYLVGAAAYARDSEDAPARIVPYSPPKQGGRSSSTVLALNTAMTIQRRASGRGASRRGRVFHYGLTLADTVNSAQWAPSVAANIAGQYQVFIQAIEQATGGKEVIVSLKQGNVWLAEGAAYEVLTYAGNQRMATKRRRIPKVLSI